MQASSTIVTGDGLARFACDYCRQKKLKYWCSKELPKCSTCRAWPGSCNYSRDDSSSLHSAITPKQPGVDMETQHLQSSRQPSNIDERLQRIESAIQQLTNSVDQILKVVVPDDEGKQRSNSIQPITTNKSAPASELSVGSSHAFSFLRETPATIAAMTNSQASIHQRAHSEFQYLSNTLTRAAVNQRSGRTSRFYVPTERVGYSLIGRFLEYIKMGELFFMVPSHDIIRQVVFDPENVVQKAWVVCFNYMILSIISTENDQSNEAEKFRRNTQLALNDSSIFLEPSEVNIQALVLLAIHGEDFASPNLSWMLVGHACRQAEALELHAAEDNDIDVRQRKLCLFWILFAIDKSCALAFGRSVFLPAALYSNVPMPDHRYLFKFHPHDSPAISGSRSNIQTSAFGAQFFSSLIEVAKLTGYIVNLLAYGESSQTKDELKSKLEAWYSHTNKILLENIRRERTWANATQLREMFLGLNSIKFGYLHTLIVLLKGDISSSSLRLASAREAISLLPSLVSNWSSVYNGVTWQLLYYPFNPFFVVFENIVHSRSGLRSMVDHDLGLLATTVSYFASMRAQLRLLANICSRLERVASAFLQLAQYHVRNTVSRETASQAGTPTYSSQLPLPHQADHRSFSQVEERTRNEFSSNYPHSNEVTQDFNIEELDLDCYLQWLPADITASWPISGFEKQNSSAGPDVATASNSTQSRKRALDSTFDWFSWDAYYAGTSQ